MYGKGNFFSTLYFKKKVTHFYPVQKSLSIKGKFLKFYTNKNVLVKTMSDRVLVMSRLIVVSRL